MVEEAKEVEVFNETGVINPRRGDPTPGEDKTATFETEIFSIT